MATINLDTFLDQFKGLNPSDPATWPLIPRAVAIAVVFTMVVFFGWFFYLSDLAQQQENAVDEEKKLKEAYVTKTAQAINLDALRQQKEQISQHVNALEKKLPSKSEMDALLSDINQAGVGRGLQFELFKPGQVAVKDYYAELPISLRVSGRYHDLAAFSSDIANLSRIVTLNDMTIKAAEKSNNSNRLTMEATAKTFRYLDADEVTAIQKSKTGKKK